MLFPNGNYLYTKIKRYDVDFVVQSYMYWWKLSLYIKKNCDSYKMTGKKNIVVFFYVYSITI